MSDLSELTIEELVGEMVDPAVNVYIYGGIEDHMRADIEHARMDAIMAEARRRDAQRTTWPTGHAAAEQLEEALIWVSGTLDLNETYAEVAAAVLARLHETEPDHA